jgi:hypothetical protein
MIMNKSNNVYLVFEAGNVAQGTVLVKGHYLDYDVARKEARRLTEDTGVLHEVEARGGSSPCQTPA